MLSSKQVQELNIEFGFKASEEELNHGDSLPPGWEQCPLCPGHLDESCGFIWNDLLSANVCHGCSYDIHYALVGEEERPLVSEGYKYSESQIGLLEQLTGQTFHQLKFRHLTDVIKKYTGTAPDYITDINFLTMPEPELRLLNKRLDEELRAITEAKNDASSDEDIK